MKTSARNQFLGTISGVREGAINDEVELTTAGGQHIVATVTRESRNELKLEPGARAFALVKASSIVLLTQDENVRLSARNQLKGTVRSIAPGTVNAEVLLDLAGGTSVAVIITQHSMQVLGLAPGDPATAVFKASSVILAWWCKHYPGQRPNRLGCEPKYIGEASSCQSPPSVGPPQRAAPSSHWVASRL